VLLPVLVLVLNPAFDITWTLDSRGEVRPNEAFRVSYSLVSGVGGGGIRLFIRSAES